MSLPDWADLPLPQQVAQLIVVRASGYCFDHQIQYPALEPPAATLRHWVESLGVGGVILLGGSAVEVGLRSQQLQQWAKIPLLLAADIEEGVGQRFTGATWFPPPMALGAIAQRDRARALHLAEAFGSVTAQEAIAIGLNWVLAPVADVNNNPLNPVINVRAFGDEPDLVADLVSAFVRGSQRRGVLTTAKHFPGHGDTATDSHIDLPILPYDRPRLNQVEWLPFRRAIAAGVDGIMTAHLHLPALDATAPATLSSVVLNQCLRQDLGFEGLIITDALVMGAIARTYGTTAAALKAFQAGADILLMPADPVATVTALCQAIEEGQIPLERLHASLDRLWHAKHRILAPHLPTGNSHQWDCYSPPVIDLDRIATPEAIATATAIVDESSTVVGTVPILPPTPAQTGWNVVLVDRLIPCPFLDLTSPALTLPDTLGYQPRWLDPYCLSTHSGAEAIAPLSPDAIADAILVQVFVRGTPFRGKAGLLPQTQTWLSSLAKTGRVQALVIYGSPYVIDVCQSLLPHVPCLFSYGQMAIAQRVMMQKLFGAALPTQGRSLPFTD